MYYKLAGRDFINWELMCSLVPRLTLAGRVWERGKLMRTMLTCIILIIIQLIFLQQYFAIPVPCNITRYCTGVIARALGLRGILATTMCFN